MRQPAVLAASGAAFVQSGSPPHVGAELGMYWLSIPKMLSAGGQGGMKADGVSTIVCTADYGSQLLSICRNTPPSRKLLRLLAH
mmetsp:Transcript_3828/g.13633  ORF Transcript_3828/g.13633 Transcript_3828/m.13633 type:complete len:84 (-) Transcript_3828:377-628(-)